MPAERGLIQADAIQMVIYIGRVVHRNGTMENQHMKYFREHMRNMVLDNSYRNFSEKGVKYTSFFGMKKQIGKDMESN